MGCAGLPGQGKVGSGKVEHKGRCVLNGGFVALYRKIRDNFVWEAGRPRTRLEAWLDLVMEAQHSTQPQPILIKGRLLCCQRGQSLKALETWAERWSWSKSKVVRFFEVLEKKNMIEHKSEGVTTRLTVVNYDRYNPLRNGDGASGGTQTDTESETKPEPKPEQSNIEGARTCENERNADDTANDTRTSHRRQDDNRQQGEQFYDRIEKAHLEQSVVDNRKLLSEAERFSAKLNQAFGPLDKRNAASFDNLKHDMCGHARHIDPGIFLEGISLVCKAQESEGIKNRRAWVMKSIKNKMDKGCSVQGGQTRYKGQQRSVQGEIAAQGRSRAAVGCCEDSGRKGIDRQGI